MFTDNEVRNTEPQGWTIISTQPQVVLDSQYCYIILTSCHIMLTKQEDD